MHKLISAFALVALSTAAVASESCNLHVPIEKLELSQVEKAKLEIYLQKKNFTLNKGMFGGLGGFPGGAPQGFGFNPYNVGMMGTFQMLNNFQPLPPQGLKFPKQYVLNARIELPEGEEQDKSLLKVVEKNGEDETISLKKLKDVELVLLEFTGFEQQPKKVLKPRQKLLFREKGSPGYLALKSLFKDLPKCDEEKEKVAVNSSAREQEKQLPQVSSPFSFPAFFSGSTMY
jgi:hypothetical protein